MNIKIATAVLAGGQSRRMGEPKALLPYQGTTLVEHLIGQLIDQLKQPSDAVVVAGCPTAGLYSGLSVPCVGRCHA